MSGAAHPQETRDRALALVAGGESVASTARTLKVDRSTVRAWVGPRSAPAAQDPQEGHEVTAILEDGTTIVGSPAGLASTLRALGVGR